MTASPLPAVPAACPRQPVPRDLLFAVREFDCEGTERRPWSLATPVHAAVVQFSLRPSTRRGNPSGFASRSSGGSSASGASW
jgi:hypothetical protein